MAEDDTDDHDREGSGIERVEGVGPDTAEALSAAGIESAAELADASTDDLTAVDGIGEPRADDLRSAAVGLVGEVAFDIYEDEGVSKYWTLETTAGDTVVGGAPGDFDVLKDRLDGMDVFVPQRTDGPARRGHGHGEIHSTSWQRLFGEDRDELPDEYVPNDLLAPPEGDRRAANGSNIYDALQAVRERNRQRDFDMTAAEAKRRDIKDVIHVIVSDDDQAVVENPVDDDERDDPFEIETEEGGTLEILPTSVTGAAIRYEADGETRVLAVDFDGLGTKNSNTYEEVYGEDVSDADAVATTDLSGYQRGQLRGDVDVVALLDGEAGELGDAAVYEGDDESPTYVLGPGVLAHGEDLSMEEETESIVDDLDPDGTDYDAGDHRSHGRP